MAFNEIQWEWGVWWVEFFYSHSNFCKRLNTHYLPLILIKTVNIYILKEGISTGSIIKKNRENASFGVHFDPCIHSISLSATSYTFTAELLMCLIIQCCFRPCWGCFITFIFTLCHLSKIKILRKPWILKLIWPQEPRKRIMKLHSHFRGEETEA